MDHKYFAMGFFEIRLIDIYLILTFFAVTVVLLAVAFFPKNRKAENGIFAIIIALFASHLALIATHYVGWLPEIPAQRIGYVFNLSYGPLFLAFFEKSLKGKAKWHWLAIWASAGILLPFFHLGGPFYRAIIVMSFVLNLAMSFRLFKRANDKPLAWHRFALIFFSLLSLTYSLEMMFIPISIETAWLMRFVYFTELIILVIGFLYFSLHNPVNFLHVRIVNTRVQASLDTVSLSTELKLIINSMERGQLYQNPELSRSDFEHLTGLSVNRISELINVGFSINFSEWVNRYRIEEAKTLLCSNSELSIKDVYYSVGFNSKSAFYSAFKKQVGQTPTQYRQQISSQKKAA